MNRAELSMRDGEKFFVHAGTRVDILKKTSVTFTQGISYAIMGASGIGKSTLMHMLSGLELPNSGSVLFNGHDLAQSTLEQKSLFLNQSIGLVFQQPYLIRELCVLENVMVPGMVRELPTQESTARAHELLAHVELTHKAQSKVATLSGGQQQRVALARALFNRPQFLLADEPTGSLDAQTGKLMVELLCSLQREYGMGIIVSTHDRDVAVAMDQVYSLQDGHLVAISL